MIVRHLDFQDAAKRMPIEAPRIREEFDGVGRARVMNAGRQDGKVRRAWFGKRVTA